MYILTSLYKRSESPDLTVDAQNCFGSLLFAYVPRTFFHGMVRLYSTFCLQFQSLVLTTRQMLHISIFDHGLLKCSLILFLLFFYCNICIIPSFR